MIEIATFAKVVESGGFAAASRKLEMSPSTVTAHIQDLEQQLGARLLNRTTRKVSLTEIGKAYYERCLQILADVDEADNVVQALQSTPRGTLRINVSVAVPQLMTSVLAEYSSRYPDVRLNVIMTDRMIDMIEEGIDLAIRPRRTQREQIWSAKRPKDGVIGRRLWIAKDFRCCASG